MWPLIIAASPGGVPIHGFPGGLRWWLIYWLLKVECSQVLTLFVNYFYADIHFKTLLPISSVNTKDTTFRTAKYCNISGSLYL